MIVCHINLENGNKGSKHHSYKCLIIDTITYKCHRKISASSLIGITTSKLSGVKRTLS